MKKTLLLSLLILALLIPAIAGAAGLKLAAPFGDAMVLQRDIAVPVWGTADPEATITVSFAGQTKTAKANAKGDWSLKLDPLAASALDRVFVVTSTGGTPSDAAAKVEFKQVLVGEVWICSGQSNMEQGIAMKGTYKGQEEVANGTNPLIRIRYSNHATGRAPNTNFNGSGWQLCSPESLPKGPWGGFSAVGYLFGKTLQKELGVPVGLIQSAWGGTRIEPWTPAEAFKAVPGLEALATPAPANKRAAHQTPSALYNGMIHPLVPYAIRGAIWYQGESNLGETDYAAKTRALVQGWRTVWKQGDFPFYFVQLAPYTYNGDTKRLAVSWEQQTNALAIPNTGMAIINDAGNLKDIHPGDKHTVAARLARLALSRTYGKKFADDCGPLFKSATVDAAKGKITVSFNHVASGLTTSDGKAPTHFEAAGRDGIFHPATAVIVGNTVEVTCDELTRPTQVRFAWDEKAVPNLTNGEKIPAGAFRSNQ